MLEFFSTLFQKFSAGIASLGDYLATEVRHLGGALLDLFGVGATILDVINGLGLAPITATVGALLNVLIDLVAGVLTILCNSGLGLFSSIDLEYGTGKTLYEKVFMDGFDTLFGVIPIIAYGFLALFLMAHMAQLLRMPVNGGDTPFGLAFKTILCGMLIFNTKPLAKTAAGFFNLFYLQILGNPDLSKVSFDILGESLSALVVEDGFLSSVKATTQIKALVGSLLMLVLLIIIAVQLLKFMLEFVQRYVLFYTLLATAPLAFTLAPSKETSSAFARWVQMLFSEGFLLTIHVFFFRLFIAAFDTYQTTLQRIESDVGEGIAPALIWGLLIYSVLYIGNMMDSYLKTIGIASNEMGASLFADAVNTIRCLDSDMVIGNQRGSNIWSSRHSLFGKSVSIARSAVPAFMKGSQNVQMRTGNVSFDKNPATGIPTPESIGKVLRTNGARAQGPDLGRGVINAARGFPSKYAKDLNYSTARLVKGTISIDSVADTAGSVTTYTFTPFKGELAKSADFSGRAVSIDGLTYIVSASGEKALQFTTYNPSFMRVMQERGYSPRGIHEIRDNSGKRTGIYKTVQQMGNGREIKLYKPLSAYKVDAVAEKSGVVEDIGGLPYSVVTMHEAYDAQTKTYVPGLAYENLQALDASLGTDFQRKWIKDNFFGMDYTEIKSVERAPSDPAGIRYTTIYGETHYMRPLAMTVAGDDLTAEAVNIQTAVNGTTYLDVIVPQRKDKDADEKTYDPRLGGAELDSAGEEAEQLLRSGSPEENAKIKPSISDHNFGQVSSVLASALGVDDNSTQENEEK